MKGRTEKRPKSLAPVEQIERAILLIRGHKVMVDADLATLYGVATKVLNQAVTRNERRFPPDFMFRMTESEKDELVTNCDRLQRLKHSTTLPRVFTEQGVAMLSSVLNSDRAVQVNTEIMRAFVRLRQMLDAHKDLRRKLAELEKKYDDQFKIVFKAIAELMSPPEKPHRIYPVKLGLAMCFWKARARDWSKEIGVNCLGICLTGEIGFEVEGKADRVWKRGEDKEEMS
jgi:hypothetical protein